MTPSKLRRKYPQLNGTEVSFHTPRFEGRLLAPKANRSGCWDCFLRWGGRIRRPPGGNAPTLPAIPWIGGSRRPTFIRDGPTPRLERGHPKDPKVNQRKVEQCGSGDFTRLKSLPTSIAEHCSPETKRCRAMCKDPPRPTAKTVSLLLGLICMRCVCSWRL